jgi:hypothetical protein
MTDRTILLRADVVERLEALAQGRNLNDVLDDLLQRAVQQPSNNWALAVSEGMEAADIEWLDEEDASEQSRARYREHVLKRWQDHQDADDGN